MKGYYLDPDSDVAGERYAVVYAPRRQRERFPENCVTLVDTPEAAREAADPTGKRYAAKVVGPARSSEGLRMYYLVVWLD